MVLSQNGPPAPQDLQNIGKLENPKQKLENIGNNWKTLENLSKNWNIDKFSNFCLGFPIISNIWRIWMELGGFGWTWVDLGWPEWIWMDLGEPWRPGAHFSMILI